MTDAGAAVGMDRLPWLDDEPGPRAEPTARAPKPRPARSSRRDLAGWAAAAILLVAGGSYWLGMQSGEQARSDRYEAPASPPPEATVRLPDARTPTVPIVEAPEIRPAPVPSVSVPEPAASRSTVRTERRGVRSRTLKPMDMKDSDLSKTVAEQEAAAGMRLLGEALGEAAA